MVNPKQIKVPILIGFPVSNPNSLQLNPENRVLNPNLNLEKMVPNFYVYGFVKNIGGRIKR
jgi:hypothetical protein